MLKGFRDFVLRGNVVDLAVGVVIGAAFGAVVTALVKDLITPIIAALVKKPDFSGFFFEINGAKFLYGDFANAVISFLLIAAAVYYLVVLPVNNLMKRFKAPALLSTRGGAHSALQPLPSGSAKTCAARSPNVVSEMGPGTT